MDRTLPGISLQRYWKEINLPDLDWKKVLLVAGVGIAGGLILRKAWRGLRYSAHISRTDDLSDPNSYAQRLNQAFHPQGGGTDEKLVREIIRAVPHKAFWNQVISTYGSGGYGNLLADLEYELPEPMHREIMLIIDSMPDNSRDASSRTEGYYDSKMLQNWALRIKEACDYEYGWLWPWGHDFDGILAVFRELPYARVICEVDQYYRHFFYSGLWDELRDEFGGKIELLETLALELMQKPDGKQKTIRELIALCAG